MKVLISAEQIQRRLDELAWQVAEDYRQRQPMTIVGVLTGSLMFLADLVRRISLPVRIGLVQASSYRGETTTAGELRIDTGLTPDLRGRHVLLLDDILDTGRTISRLATRVRELGASSVRVAVLLRKLGRQLVPFEPDYTGFEVPDAFVVGYGLDYNDEFRHLPYVGILSQPESAP